MKELECGPTTMFRNHNTTRAWNFSTLERQTKDNNKNKYFILIFKS